MPGSIVNLSTPGAPLPDPVIVDTNLIVERLIVPFIGTVPPPIAVNAQRAAQFFHDLAANNGTGIVTPTAYNEFIHVAIKIKYRHEALQRRQTYGRTLSWSEL